MSQKRPLHLWLIALGGLLWNFGGIVDFYYTVSGDVLYLERLTDQQRELITSLPLLVILLWAIAVFASFAACIALLLQRAIAEKLFLISLAAMLLHSVYSFALTDTAAQMGPAAFSFAVIIFVISLLLWLYAIWMRRIGLLH